MPPAIRVDGSWAEFASGGGRAVLAGVVLPGFIARQRWFPAKGRTVSAVTVDEAVPLPLGDAVLFIVAVGYEDGGRHRFAVPLAFASGDLASRIRREAPDRVAAEVVSGPGDTAVGVIHDDATTGMGASLAVAMAQGLAWPAGAGEIVGMRTPAFERLSGGRDVAALEARRVSGEQSNTSFVLGDSLIVKLIRRLEPGLNPDFEIGRHLTERAPFPGVPALAGAVLWRGAAPEPTVVAVAQAYVPGATVLRERIVADIAAFMRAELPSLDRGWTAPEGACRSQFDAVASLGRKTGGLHLALSNAQGDAAFAPAPATAGDLEDIARRMRTQVNEALDVLAAKQQGLSAGSARLGARVLAARTHLETAVDAVARVSPGLARIRVHGDYQLDQVLVAGGEFVIIDFEGEPLRPLAERREKFLAVKDVAGMLRSFSYAAYAALFEVAGEDEAIADRLDPIARWWQEAACGSFVEGYRETAGRAVFVPTSRGDFDTLLSAFLVEKATYELRYEIGHRPRWLRIPLRGMADLLEGLGHA